MSENYVLVSSKMISKKDNQQVSIDWRVFKVKDKLLIRDLVVEGLSLAKTQREEFSSILSSKGFEGLMENLNNFISKLIKEGFVESLLKKHNVQKKLSVPKIV